MGIVLACSAANVPAGEAPKALPAATGTAAAPLPGSGAAVPAPAPIGTVPKAVPPVIVTPPAENEQPAVAKPRIQVAGRLIHTWYDKPGLRVILVIDGFTVQSRQEQLTARDGVIWFDEDEARKTGRVSLGIFAETGVEYRRAGGQIDKFDSVYLVMETTGELSLRSQEPERGKADNTELFLRQETAAGVPDAGRPRAAHGGGAADRHRLAAAGARRQRGRHPRRNHDRRPGRCPQGQLHA